MLLAADYHIPVMLEESMEGLAIKAEGTYVDVTYGGGGHSAAILDRLGPKGRLIAFDRDVDAQANLTDDKRLTLVHHEFIHLENFLDYFGIEKVDGLMADLGISSHQVDSPERGFSFRWDAVLDMRMDKQNPVSARDILNQKDEAELQSIFSSYGEIRNARTLARAIVSKRKIKAIQTTGELAKIAEELLPPRENVKKYLAPVFQALRIAVNDELGGLKSLLEQCADVIKPGGRLVVLTYHSLEDRLVKNFLQTGNFEDKVEKDVFGNSASPWKLIHRKPLTASEAEVAMNSRARSAKLRVAEKV